MNNDDTPNTGCNNHTRGVRLRSASHVGGEQVLTLSNKGEPSTVQEVEHMLWSWMMEDDYLDLLSWMTYRVSPASRKMGGPATQPCPKAGAERPPLKRLGEILPEVVARIDARAASGVGATVPQHDRSTPRGEMQQIDVEAAQRAWVRKAIREKEAPHMPHHLRDHEWYARHQAWQRRENLPHHYPGFVEPEQARLVGDCLAGERLPGAILRGAVLVEADLSDVDLSGADLIDAEMSRADLSGASLRYAHLLGVCLRGANLKGADLRGANLMGVTLDGASLDKAILPDGRTLAEWQADPLQMLCWTPDAIAAAVDAWDVISHYDGPIQAGMGIGGPEYIDDNPTLRRQAAAFVALHHAGLLPKPNDKEDK